MNKTIFLALLALAAAIACSRSSESKEETTAPASTDVVERSPAALRQTYMTRMAARKSPLPLKQEKAAGSLLPVDEAPLDTAFFVMREDLLDIIAKKDAHALLGYIDPHIRSGFDSQNGLPDFVRFWKLDVPGKSGESALWQHLEDVLQRGGIFDADRQHFNAPYYFATFPEDLDGIENAVINAREVRMREAAGLNGKVIRNLSFEIVKLLEQSPAEEVIDGRSYPWYKIKTSGGTEGWVYGRFIGLPAGWRATFERQGSKWRMVMFLSGD